MKPIALTNNSLVYEALEDKNILSELICNESSAYEDILRTAAGMVRKGHKLLMSPFYGNIPPIEMPYKTIILSERLEALDLSSARMLEAALGELRRQFREQARTYWGKDDLACFKRSDLVIVERWLTKVYYYDNKAVMSMLLED